MNEPNPSEQRKPGLFSELAPEPAPAVEPKVRRRPAGPRKVSERELREVVSEVRPDDGIDPKDLAHGRRHRRDAEGEPLGQAHGEHRQEQFLEQVRTALDSALLATTSAVLNTLGVQAVAKQRGSLVAVLSPRDPSDEVDVSVAAAEIRHATAFLAREVARAITRKDVPHLRFEILPRGPADEA